MPSYPTPNWLQPADLPAAWTTGFQIGNKIGAQKAQEELAQAQMQREIQKEAVEEARKKAEFSLKVEQAANRYRSQQQYQKLVASGVDPKTALLQLGPSLGIPMAGLSQLARPSPQAFTPQTMTLPGGQTMIQHSPNVWAPAPGPKPSPEDVTAQAQSRIEETARYHRELEQSRKENQLMRLESAHKADIQGMTASTMPANKRNPLAKTQAANYEARQNQIDALRKQIEAMDTQGPGQPSSSTNAPTPLKIGRFTVTPQ